jgi:type II secretory pathway component PulC
MKSPLWIIDSTLAMILLAMIAFIMYSFKSIFERPALAPLKVMPKVEALKKEEGKPKDLRLVYEENDLFGTYRPSIIPVKVAETLPVLPPPPSPRPVMPRVKPLVQFLEPLPVKITGIIASSNDAKSQVTVINNTTKKSESYRIGDKLFDAYIIRIFPRKVIIIRSNGQQETLFMYPSDAQEETQKLKDTSWSDVVQQQSQNNYLINPTIFAQRVISLGHLIDMADLTTAFKGGKALGVRVGKIEPTSIANALGFLAGDVVTKIQGIAPTSTMNRMKIHNLIGALDMGSDISVQLTRRGQLLSYTYTLFNLAEPTASFDLIPAQPEAAPKIVTPPPAPAAMPAPPAGPPQQQPAQQAPQPPTGKSMPAAALQAPPATMSPPPGKAQAPKPFAAAPIQSMQKKDKEAMKQFGSKEAMQAAMPPPPGNIT